MDTHGLTESRYNAILSLLQNIIKKEGVRNPKIEIVKGCAKGDGFAGEKNIAIVRGDQHKSLQLFIKAAPTNPAYRQAFDMRPIYLQEIFFYKDVYPTFNEFQTKKNGPDPFTSVIECLDTSSEVNNEMIVLQNVKQLGYELWDRKKQMSTEHVEFVYKEYGKFHGLSYALKDQEPDVFENLVGKFPMAAFQMMADAIVGGCTKMAEEVKAQIDPTKEAKVYNTYCGFIDSMYEFLVNIQYDAENKHRVIIHGDCWCSNMMFKYAPNSKKDVPEKMCLLDFQITSYASPALDLCYFMYASSPPEIYNNYERYLKIYHESLSKTVRDLGSGQNSIPTLMELKNQWKSFAKYGLIMAYIVFKACLQDEDETQDISEVLEENGDNDMMAAFSKKIRNDDVYFERIKALIGHMVQNDFL